MRLTLACILIVFFFLVRVRLLCFASLSRLCRFKGPKECFMVIWREKHVVDVTLEVKYQYVDGFLKNPRFKSSLEIYLVLFGIFIFEGRFKIDKCHLLTLTSFGTCDWLSSVEHKRKLSKMSKMMLSLK